MPRSGFYLAAPDVDATASIALWPASEGGRSGPYWLTGSLRYFTCPLFVDDVGHGFDVRMEPDSLDVDTLLPGATYQMRMKFLDPATAVRHFTPGRAFRLWSGGTIGSGEVEEARFEGLPQVAE